jgi:hypothetical protein
MKIDVKELKKAVELLVKNHATLVDIEATVQTHHVSLRFISNDNTAVEIKLYQHDSGQFSKIIKEETF